jgi:peptidyl-prolyl cis-trans isomerase SurA
MTSLLLMTMSHRALAAAAVSAALLCCAMVAPAAAQHIVARVNDQPITSIDVQQRSNLIKASTHKAPPSREVINELVDEILKLQAAQRYRMDIPESEIDSTIANMANRMRLNKEQFAKVLGNAGIGMGALRRKVKADIAWQQLVRGKFQASLQVRDRDIMTAIGTMKAPNTTAYDYVLRPILLIVQQGSGIQAIEARRREAEALRARFQSCDEGIRLARGLRDVAVKEPINRSSGDFNAKVREVLDATEIGHLTPPDITPQGVEVFAVCEKKAGAGDSGSERDAREQLFGKKFTAQGQKYLDELRRTAQIEIK